MERETRGAPMVISFRAIIGAGVLFALVAGVVSHAFTLATGTALWTLEADPSASFSYVMLMNQVYWVTWACLTPAIFRFADRFKLTSDTWKRRLPLHVAAGSAFVFLHAVLAGTGRSWLQAAYGMDTVWLLWIKQQFLRTFDWELTYYAAAVGARHAIVYYEAARDREVQAAQLETRLVEAQLQALQRQLHPHFLFNTLHAISALVRRNPDAAEEAIERLGDLLRLTLQNVGAQEVTVREELDYLRVYLDIERMHFGARLSVTLDIDGAAHDALMPHLLLQPLVENAIRHGIAPRLSPGQVGIQVSTRTDRLLVRVWDDGVGLRTVRGSRLSGGVGLSNTRARLERLYGSAHRLAIGEGPEGGVVVEIELPLRRAASEERPQTQPPSPKAIVGRRLRR
jgi:two-component system LytT family sensor kinase